MKDWIIQFPIHLKDGIERYSQHSFSIDRQIKSIVLCGMGGSAFGGKFVKHYLENQFPLPFEIKQDYILPAYVNEETLVISSSYSGNTEETLFCTEEAIRRNALVIGLTSGGRLKELLLSNSFPMFELPTGFAPRAAIGYSITALLSLFSACHLISNKWQEEVKEAIHIIETTDFHRKAQEIANEIHGFLPIVYTTTLMEPLAIRIRQQINENSKQLCWHHVVPEMNHNEIVGWEHPNALFSYLVVLFIHCPHELKRNQIRLQLTAKVLEQRDIKMLHLELPQYPLLTYMLVMLHWFDWISYELALANQVDPTPVAVIDYFKGELKQILENGI